MLNNHNPETHFDMIYLVKRIEDIGAAKAKTKEILNCDTFEIISKHDPYWVSEHDLEGEKLEHMRMQFKWIKNQLEELFSILNDEED